jgi:hypothetical protein
MGNLTPRRVASPDTTISDFTTIGSWVVDGLDLSLIIPPGAVGVVVQVHTAANGMSVPTQFALRANASDALVNMVAQTVNSNALGLIHTYILPIDPDRKLDYYVYNNQHTIIEVSIVGWF